MLKIQNLKKSYGNFQLQVSMEIHKGKVTALIGRNGSGKTTIFKSILGLICPDEGEILLFEDSKDSSFDKKKQNLGVVLSDSGFSGYLTIKQIKTILAHLYDNFQEKEFECLLRKMDLPINKKINEFSTGMKVKLKLIIALSHKPKLLLLDEPTSGLDVVAREDLLSILREYLEKNEEASILLSSHISSDLEGFCDDFYLIDQGKIFMHEETDIILSNYGVIKVREEDYNKLDKGYIIEESKEVYGYKLLTNQRQFYRENYPNLIIEKANIDSLISTISGGEKK